MKRKLKTITLFILLIAVFQLGVTKVEALTVDSLKYRINQYSKSFDIYGTINNGNEFSSTFGNEGFLTFFQVGDFDDGSFNYINTFNADKVIDGIKVNVSLSEDNDSNSVIAKYSFTNVSDEKQTFRFGTYADNKLAENDKAAIYKDGHSRIIVTQDDSTNYPETYGTQFSISFSPEVNTSRLGIYDYNDACTDYMFVDGDVLSYTYYDGKDTIITYSWNDTLEVNETKTYTVTFNARVAETSTVKFYKYGESTPIVKDVLVGGAIMTETVNSEENYIYEWNTKKDGTGKYYPANKSIIVPEKDMVLYEIKYDKNHNIVIDSNDNVNITTENGSSVEHHGTLKYNITPKVGYKIVSVMVNNVERLSEVKNNVLTINDVMGDVNIDVKAVPDYKITNGANQKYVVNKDSKLIFETNSKYEAFANDGKLYVDNTLVNKNNYSFAKDSDGKIIFTLNKKYLDTLSNGSHNLKIAFNDGGEITTTFTIQNNTLIENPETSDNIVYFIATSVISMIGLAGVNIFKRKQLNN